jgi:hypothetical protein
MRYSSLLRGVGAAGRAVGSGVQAVPAILIATANISFAFWFIALPFSFYAILQVVQVAQNLNELNKERSEEATEQAGATTVSIEEMR